MKNDCKSLDAQLRDLLFWMDMIHKMDVSMWKDADRWQAIFSTKWKSTKTSVKRVYPKITSSQKLIWLRALRNGFTEEITRYVQISNKGNMKDDISATSKISLGQNEKTIAIAAYSCSMNAKYGS